MWWLLVICELLIFYEATKGLFVGMGDPPGIIYSDGYGSVKIPPSAIRYGDTHGVIVLSWGWVWGVHTRWGFTHCHLESWPASCWLLRVTVRGVKLECRFWTFNLVVCPHHSLNHLAKAYHACMWYGALYVWLPCRIKASVVSFICISVCSSSRMQSISSLTFAVRDACNNALKLEHENEPARTILWVCC
jgi:hypothetical protein